MKLDPTVVRYLSEEDWRVLTAVEMGMRNHELVPTPLIERIAGLRLGGVKKCLVQLLRYKLIVHENRKYDGYKLVYGGYDYLALHAFVKRNRVASVGNRIGVGKEADVFVVADSEGREMILKLHRLGRTSFQSVTRNRDYTRRPGRRGGAGWLYLSRLAAQKEYAFMRALCDAGFAVPTPIDQNRHCVLMSVVPGFVLANISVLGHPERVYARTLKLLTRLAQYGLIHGDLNEHNLMITDDEHVWFIDFPQMVSTEHPNAQHYFDRDLRCVHAYFGRRFNLRIDYSPLLRQDPDLERRHDLDAAVGASGWSRSQQREMDRLLRLQQRSEAAGDEEEGEGSDSAEEGEEEEGEEGEEREAREQGQTSEAPNPQGSEASPAPLTEPNEEASSAPVPKPLESGALTEGALSAVTDGAPSASTAAGRAALQAETDEQVQRWASAVRTLSPAEALELQAQAANPDESRKHDSDDDDDDEEDEEDEEDAEEDEEEEEEPDPNGCTPDQDSTAPAGPSPLEPSRRLLNQKGRGFFNQERMEDAQVGLEMGPDYHLAATRAGMSRKKVRESRSVRANEKRQAAANPAAEGAPPPALEGLTDDYIRRRVMGKLAKDAVSQELRVACRANVQKGRQKIRDAQAAKYAEW
eukprot:RCo030363